MHTRHVLFCGVSGRLRGTRYNINFKNYDIYGAQTYSDDVAEIRSSFAS